MGTESEGFDGGRGGEAILQKQCREKVIEDGRIMRKIFRLSAGWTKKE